MARRRSKREDLTFAEWHRNRLSEFYTRIGHRLDMADRDWTEFCHYCKRPLAIVEEVIDKGQNLNEKSVTVTRNLASMAGVEAYLVAPKIDRPAEVWDLIDELGKQITELEAAYPITTFSIKTIRPYHDRNIRVFSEEEAAKFFLAIHRRHHQDCSKANQFPVKNAALRQAESELGMPPVMRDLFEAGL